jgi:hypothetical protein
MYGHIRACQAEAATCNPKSSYPAHRNTDLGSKNTRADQKHHIERHILKKDAHLKLHFSWIIHGYREQNLTTFTAKELELAKFELKSAATATRTQNQLQDTHWSLMPWQRRL